MSSVVGQTSETNDREQFTEKSKLNAVRTMKSVSSRPKSRQPEMIVIAKQQEQEASASFRTSQKVEAPKMK